MSRPGRILLLAVLAAAQKYSVTAMPQGRNWLRLPDGLAVEFIQASPGAVAQAPYLWRGEATRSGVRVQAASAESVAPDSLRTPIERAELEQGAMRIEAEIASGFTVSIAAYGARAAYDDTGVSHLDAVQPDLSLRLTREIVEGVSVSLISESGRAASGVSFTPGVERQATAARASFDFARAGFDFTMGEMQEERGILGLIWSKEFGATPGGEARFAGFGAHFDVLSILRLSGSAEFGVAEMANSGWVNVVDPLRTSAFSLQARAVPSDIAGAIMLSLMQPLRVEGGAFAFMAPTATKYGRQSLGYQQRVFSPTPSGRELRFGLGYSYWRGDEVSAFGEALYVLQPGHIADADPDVVLRFGVRVAN